MDIVLYFGHRFQQYFGLSRVSGSGQLVTRTRVLTLEKVPR